MLRRKNCTGCSDQRLEVRIRLGDALKLRDADNDIHSQKLSFHFVGHEGAQLGNAEVVSICLHEQLLCRVKGVDDQSLLGRLEADVLKTGKLKLGVSYVVSGWIKYARLKHRPPNAVPPLGRMPNAIPPLGRISNAVPPARLFPVRLPHVGAVERGEGYGVPTNKARCRIPAASATRSGNGCAPTIRARSEPPTHTDSGGDTAAS